MIKIQFMANLDKTPTNCFTNNQELVLIAGFSEEDSSHSFHSHDPTKYTSFGSNLSRKKPRSNSLKKLSFEDMHKF